MSDYFVYIMTSNSGILYTGMTNDLERRIWEHKTKAVPGFTKKYNISQLLWFESTGNVNDAIEFEKRIKGWSRAKKIILIEKSNPKWNDLAAEWFT